MCGIAGFFSPDKKIIPQRDVFDAALESMASRGPDFRGVLRLEEPGLLLGHNRLSILDLSSGANQPMTDANGNALVFNGEIYNFAVLRAGLERSGVVFKTRSDTEVLLALHAAHRDEPEAVSAMLEGMFAYAYFDARRRSLFLARDRAGEKPLYYSAGSGFIAFASTAEAARRLMPSSEPDPGAARHMLAYDVVPAGGSIWKELKKLLPGECLRYPAKDGPSVNWYWRFGAGEESGLVRGESLAAAAGRLDGIFTRCVKDMSVADVPVGVFLSGGVDSTLVTRALRPFIRELHTFSVGFSGEGYDNSYDESEHARLAASRLGTIHHHETFGLDFVTSRLDALFEGLDEPMGDPSYVATWHLAEAARRHVTVALGGDGADELFYGYVSMPFERFGPVMSLPFLKIPAVLLERFRPLAAREKYMSFAYKAFQMSKGLGWNAWDRNQRWASAADGDRYFIMPVPGGAEPHGAGVGRVADDHWTAMERFYFEFYLPLSVLAKSDRASMAHSLEVRAPFLHPAVLAFAHDLGRGFKLRGFEGKAVLRSILRSDPRVAPLAERRKHGFAIPVAAWLRHPAVRRDFISCVERTRGFLEDCAGFHGSAAFVRAMLDGRMTMPKLAYNLYVLAKWAVQKRI